MILATDLDRTLLPNGHDEYDGTLPLLFEEIGKLDVTLVYVSGRNLALFEEARREFDIEIPDFFLGSVGTEMFKKEEDRLVADTEWVEHLRANTPNWNVEEFKKRIGDLPVRGLTASNAQAGTQTGMDGLRLQEQSVQNEFKLSFYLDDFEMKKDIAVAHITDAISGTGTKADVVYSVDPLKNIGLIDVLPKIATKITALEYLRKKLGVAKEEVVYCGDSGNDLLPLTFGYKSVLMKNARPIIKEKAMNIVKKKNINECLYIAKGEGKYNGNYSSGILEGLEHFGVI